MTNPAAQLVEWSIARVGATDQHRLYLRCSNEVAAQLERKFGSALRPRVRLPKSDWDEWTHRYPLTRGLTDEEISHLDRLRRAVKLWLPAPVKVGIALDWYQDPASHEDPMHWKKTATGRLVHDGKYSAAGESLDLLSAEVATFIDVHEDLARADVIVGVPSHSPHRFSERLAAAVGRHRGVPVVTVEDDINAPIKETDPSARPTPTFRLDPGAFAGRHALILDDLVRSGESVLALARHLDGSGAASVCVLAAVRTMRN